MLVRGARSLARGGARRLVTHLRPLDDGGVGTCPAQAASMKARHVRSIFAVFAASVVAASLAGAGFACTTGARSLRELTEAPGFTQLDNESIRGSIWWAMSPADRSSV